MKKFYEVGKYEQWVEIQDGKVVKFNCTCPDFLFRRLKSKGDGPDRKTRAVGQCKHLNLIMIYANSPKETKKYSENSSGTNVNNVENLNQKSENSHHTESREETPEENT